MSNNQKNYSITNIGALSGLSDKKRVMFRDELGLSGCEISANSLAAGQSIPFVHTHKQNEEVYIILQGSGTFMVDDDEFTIQEGSFIKVAPAGKRVLAAGETELIYLCIQTQQGSLK